MGCHSHRRPWAMTPSNWNGHPNQVKLFNHMILTYWMFWTNYFYEKSKLSLFIIGHFYILRINVLVIKHTTMTQRLKFNIYCCLCYNLNTMASKTWERKHFEVTLECCHITPNHLSFWLKWVVQPPQHYQIVRSINWYDHLQSLE